MRFNLFNIKEYNDRLHVWDIIGKTRATALFLFSIGCYIATFFILFSVMFDSTSEFLVSFQPSGPNDNFSEKIVHLSTIPGLCPAIASGALLRSYITDFDLSAIALNSMLYYIYQFSLGAILTIPSLIVVMILFGTTPLDQAIGAPAESEAGISFIAGNGLAFVFLISRLHLSLSTESLDSITDSLDNIEQVTRILDDAEENINNGNVQQAAQSIIDAKGISVNSESGLSSISFKSPTIERKKRSIKGRLENIAVQFDNEARYSATTHYNANEFVKSYNALLTAESIRNELESVVPATSYTSQKETIKKQEVKASLNDLACNLEKESNKYINNAENLIKDLQLQEAANNLDLAQEHIDEWERISELDTTENLIGFEREQVEVLKQQIEALKTLISDLEKIEEIGDGISYRFNTVSNGSAFHPVTEIAKMKYSRHATHAAIDKILSVCDWLTDIGEVEVAERGYRTALDASEIIEDSELCQTLESRLSTLSTKKSTEKFIDQEDFIRDNILSGESLSERGEYNKALEKFREADEDLPHEVSDNAEEVRQALQKRVDDGSANVRNQILFEALETDNTITERRLEKIYSHVGLSTITEEKVTHLTSEEFDRLREDISNVVNQLDLTHSIQSRAESSQTNFNGHGENISEFLHERLQPFSSEDGVESENNHSIDVESVSNIEASVSDANNKASVYAKTIQGMEEAYISISSESVHQCISTTEKRLLNDSVAAFSIGEHEEVQRFIEKISAYDILVRHFSLLPIDNIIHDISSSIESGERIAVTAFNREFERVESLVNPELDSICTELESFVDTWGNHPSVDSDQWSRVIKQARNGDEFVGVVRVYQTMKTISDNKWTIEDLHEPDWEQFEHLIATLYKAKGYETEVTAGIKDFGVDVWADNNDERLAIQVKQFAPGNTVGRTVVQKLESTLARGKADRAVVVTSSSFANTAKDYVEDSENVELLDAEELVRQLIDYEVQSLSTA